MAPKETQASVTNPSSPQQQPAGNSNISSSQASGHIKLPLSMVSRGDVSRSLREVTAIDDFFHQSAVRGSKDQQLPALSRSLDSLASENNLNLLHAEDRRRLKEFLAQVKSSAPVVHISFASEASAPFLAKILEWFRNEAHPYTVLHVGLRPEIAAGCTIRTTNKFFDFSFRKRFEQSKQKLIAVLEQASKEVAEEAAVQAVTPAPAPATEPAGTEGDAA